LQPLLTESNFDVKVGFNRMPGLDIYYAADACYQAKTERLKGSWFRWTRRFRHYRDWEEAIFRKGVSTHILLITPHEVPDYNRFYQTEEARLHVLPPGIQRREFSESLKRDALVRVRKELSIAEGKNILLFVGRGFRTKGLDRAIRGMASLPQQLRLNSTLVVLGESKPGRFKVLANRLEVDDRVLFLGGRKDVYDFMLAADMLVHPAYSENTGTVLLEALTAGLPVLTTDTCGFSVHINQAEAGFVIPSPFDQNYYNQQLARMIEQKSSSSWQANGLKYTASQELYDRDAHAVEFIEKIARTK
jgi:UDP-glucose:(heptosyl)LPS alpha-1,3-glucosyltransferase